VLRELVATVKKNLIRLFRSKISAAAILFGPLMLIIIIGLAFGNAKLQGVEVGVYVPEHTPAIDNVIKGLQANNATFTVTEFKTNDSCVKSVQEGESHMCMELVAAPGKSQVQVAFYVDYSRMSLVYLMLSAMNGQVSEQATEVGTEVSKSLLNKMKDMRGFMSQNDKVLSNLSDNSEEMLVNLRAVRTSVASLNLSAPDQGEQLAGLAEQTEQNQAQIRNQQKQIDVQARDARAQITQTSQSLTASKKELDVDQDKINTLITQTQMARAGLKCDEGHLTDLTPYLDNNATLQEALNKETRPDCAVLYTAELNLKDLLKQSQSVENQIVLGMKQLDDANAKLESFQKQSSQGADNAIGQLDEASAQLAELDKQMQSGKARMQEMQTLQNELVTKLGNAETALVNSQTILAGAQQSLTKARGSLDDVSAITPEAIIKPFNTKIQSLTGKKKQFDFLFPSLLTLIVMFVSVLAASTIVMKEKASRAYFRNLISPSANFTLFIGVLLTSTILALMQVGIILLIGAVFFHVALPGILSLFIAILLGVFLFSMVGMLFGFLFNSEETTTLIALISCIILFLFSSTLIPLESMDPFLAQFARVSPFVVMELTLRHILIFDNGLGITTLPFILFVLELLGLFALTLYIIRFARRNY
jgi:ABC-type multidrug transport system permease subunit